MSSSPDGEFQWRSVAPAGNAPAEEAHDAELENPPLESFERPRPADPWRHRRGEPRVFAFVWTLYMLASVLGSLLWITRNSVLAGSAYGPAARVMLMMIILGATVLWPMARLSQVLPSGSVIRATLADLVIVALPIQVVVWPLVFLAAWPWQAILGLSALLLVWPALMGGVITLAQVIARRTRQGSVAAALLPACSMGVALAMVLTGPVVIGSRVQHAVDPTQTTLWLLSPLTHIFRLAGIGLNLPRSVVSPVDWSMLGGIGGAAGGLWFLAACLARGGREA